MWLVEYFELYLWLVLYIYYIMIIPVVPASIQHTFSPHHRCPPPISDYCFTNGRSYLLSLASPRIPIFSLPSMSNFRMFFIKRMSVSIVYGIFAAMIFPFTILCCVPDLANHFLFSPPSHFLKTDHEGKIVWEDSSASVGIFMRVTRYYLTSVFSEHHWASDSSSTPWK